MREHGTLRRRKEIIRDESNGFDGCMSGKVMAHGQGYFANLRPKHILIRTRMWHSPGKKLLHLGKVGREGAKRSSSSDLARRSP